MLRSVILKNRFFKGILSCLIAGSVFGAQWPIAGSALQIVDPYWFTLIRYLIVASILAIILFYKEGKEGFKLNRKEFPKILFLGTMAFCAYNFLVFAGQQIAGTQGTILASLLMALIPMVSILVLWITKKEFPGWRTLFLVSISLVGVILVVTKGNLSIFKNQSTLLQPVFLISLSVIAWVLYTIGGAEFKNWSSLKYTTLSCLLGNISSICAILLLQHLNISHIPSLSNLLTIKWQLLYMSVFSGVIGVLLWNIGNKLLTPQNGSLFMNLVPIITFLIEIMFGYKLTNVELIGVTMTILAIVLNNLFQRKRIT